MMNNVAEQNFFSFIFKYNKKVATGGLYPNGGFKERQSGHAFLETLCNRWQTLFR
jgi:hypothetical protein